MAWDALVVVESLTQDIDSAIVTLKPGETAHVQILRTGAVTDLILVQVFGTLDLVPGSRDQVPLFAFGIRSTEVSLSFVMRAVWGFVIQIINGKSVPTGTVTADFRYKKDGIDVG